MNRVLITAFQPYAFWKENASWLAIMDLTRDLPKHPQITTRRYPVELGQMRQQLESDLHDRYDGVLLLGQAPNSHAIRLETFALNCIEQPELGEDPRKLVEDAPLAYQTEFPVPQLHALLQEQGIPAEISQHAGVYLCNAAYFLASHYIASRGLETRVLFVHLPLECRQAAYLDPVPPSMAASTVGQSLRSILAAVAERQAI